MRKQRVVVDGEVLVKVQVDSGVHHGAVLNPLMFLLFINDIGSDTDSSVKLFARDCLFCLRISSTEDTTNFQKDFNALQEWSNC